MGTKNQWVVYEWVNISDDLVYEWVHFFKGQVYEWGRFRNTGSHTRTKITPQVTLPPPRGLVSWCEGIVFLMSLECPTDIGLHLGKACYPCSR